MEIAPYIARAMKGMTVLKSAYPATMTVAEIGKAIGHSVPEISPMFSMLFAMGAITGERPPA